MYRKEATEKLWGDMETHYEDTNKKYKNQKQANDRRTSALANNKDASDKSKVLGTYETYYDQDNKIDAIINREDVWNWKGYKFTYADGGYYDPSGTFYQIEDLIKGEHFGLGNRVKEKYSDDFNFESVMLTGGYGEDKVEEEEGEKTLEDYLKLIN